MTTATAFGDDIATALGTCRNQSQQGGGVGDGGVRLAHGADQRERRRGVAHSGGGGDRHTRSAAIVATPHAVGLAAHSGALLALTGSPVHVLVSNAAQDAGGRPFSFFEFALLGVPLLVGTIAIVVLIGSKVLPHRDATTMPPDLSALAATLARDCDLDVDNPDTLYNRKQGVAELVIPPRSGLIGKKAFPGMVTESGNLVMLGIQRDRERLDAGEVVLAAGDALLVRGSWQGLSTHLHEDEVLTVDRPDDVRRQVVPVGSGAKQASPCSH